MLTDDILELAKSYRIDISKDDDLKSLLNDIRVLLELNVKLQICDTTKTLQICDCRNKDSESKVKCKDLTAEDYFNFLYKCYETDPERALAVKEYFSKVGETVKNSLETDCAAVKGTLEDGVNEIITDAEKAIVEEVTKAPEDISEKLTDKLIDALGEVHD